MIPVEVGKMSRNSYIEKLRRKISEKISGGGRTVPVVISGQGLVPIDAAFLFPGMFVEQEIYVRIDQDQYLLFCKNTEITPAIHEKLARILAGSDHMIYVSEGDAAVLAEQSDAVFMEHETPENGSEMPVELMIEETETSLSKVRD